MDGGPLMGQYDDRYQRDHHGGYQNDNGYVGGNAGGGSNVRFLNNPQGNNN